MAFPTGWSRKCVITIPAARIAGNNTNFPILLTAANFPVEMMDGGANSALNGGGDVRFSSDAPGASQLACEIVNFVTGITPSAEVWVKLPSLNAGADKTIYVWYNKTAEIQPLAADIYGRNAVWADYSRVFHMNSVTDSSGNGDMVLVGAPTTIAGVMGGGMRFNGINQRADLNWNALSQNYTLSAVMRSPAGPAVRGGNGPIHGNSPAIEWDSNTTAQAAIVHTTGGWHVLSTGALLPNTDYWLSSTYDGVNLKGYVDGLEAATVADSGLLTSKNNFVIASHGGATTTRWLAADIFFVAITPLARSAAWIATEKNNQSDPATFAAAGVPGTTGGGAVLNIASALSGHGAENVAVSQVQLVSVASGFHPHSTDSMLILQNQTLVNSNSSHLMGGDIVPLFQVQQLIVGDAQDSLSSDAVPLGQFQALAIDDATHGLSCDVPGIWVFTSNPDRTNRTERIARLSSPLSGDRITRPTDTRTLRI